MSTNNPKPSPVTDCKLCYPNPCIGGAHRNAMIEDGEIVPNKPITPEEGETVDTLAFNLETSTGCIAASGAVKALHDAGYRVAPKPVDYEAEVKKVWPDARAAWSWNACAIILQPIQRFPSFETEQEAWKDAYSKLSAPSTTSEATHIKEVSDLLNSMKVIDRSQRYSECRVDVLTRLMYELVAYRKQAQEEEMHG